MAVGGSTRITKVQKELEKYFGYEKVNIKMDFETAIAEGAAIQAHLCVLHPDQYKEEFHFFEHKEEEEESKEESKEQDLPKKTKIAH